MKTYRVVKQVGTLSRYLWRIYVTEGEVETERLGVYETESEAEAEAARLNEQAEKGSGGRS